MGGAAGVGAAEGSGVGGTKGRGKTPVKGGRGRGNNN